MSLTKLSIALAVGAAATAMTAGTAMAAPYYSAIIRGSTLSRDNVAGSFAQTLPSSSAPGEIGVTHTDYQVGANATAQDGGSAFAKVSLAPPSTVPIDHATDLQADSAVNYIFSIVGSGPPSYVHVMVHALGGVTWNQNGAATAGFQFKDYNNPYAFTAINTVIDENAPGQSRTAGTASFGIDEILTLSTQDSYFVGVEADAVAHLSDFNELIHYGDDTASADPTFTILGDDASHYTIVGVPVPTSAAPEPGTWTMMLAGFGLVAAGLRRRRALGARSIVG